MKKELRIIAVLLCALLFTGCGNQKQENGDAGVKVGQTTKEENNTKDTDKSLKEISQDNYEVVEGHQLQDGEEVDIRATMDIVSIQRGEEAYNVLKKHNADIAQPEGEMEYIVITLDVLYEEGDTEELYLYKNVASLESASLYFALSNGDSNAEDVSESLDNCIYNLSVPRGETGQGAVAFLYNTNNPDQLRFIGYGVVAEFEMTE